MTRETVKQCKSCPWRIGCVPDRDIPNYREELHVNLRGTIREGLATLNLGSCTATRVMACHYSEPGDEFPCAGWLANQIGLGNNLGIRLGIMTGRYPAPEIDGEQHETFEDTLPKSERALSARAPSRRRKSRSKR